MDVVEEFLRGTDIVRQMIDASNSILPALQPVIPAMLELGLGNSFDNDQMRQWTGKKAKGILDEEGYEVVERGIYLPENCRPFKTATRYQRK